MNTRRMGKRVNVLIWLLLLTALPPAQGNLLRTTFREFWRYITNQEHDEQLGRNKRITTDDNASFVEPPSDPLSYVNTGQHISVEFSGINTKRNNVHGRSVFLSGLTRPDPYKSDLESNNVSSDDEKKLVARSLNEDFAQSTILEQRATLRRNNLASYDNIMEERSIENVKSDDTTNNKKKAKIISKKTKPKMTLKTVSSESVPAMFAASIDNSLTNGADLFDETSAQGEDETSADAYPVKEVYTWPKGRYGLPKSIFGCPTTYGFQWKTGFRYHDTEDDGTENQRSDVFQLAANFSEDGISHEFCIKDTEEGEGDWPRGKYCIYKRGPVCPHGLLEGFVIWDDENTDNQNDKGGALPEGQYTEDTKIFFCCSVLGKADQAIALPTKRPFFLFAYESIRCQKVYNMKATSEFIKFDDEDHGNTDFEGGEYPYGIHKAQKDHMLFLCYYEPEQAEARSFIVEPAMSTNLAADDDAMKNSTVDDDQETLRQSEEMMREFLKSTGGEEDQSAKKERTKAIIKTIKVRDGSRNSPLAVIFGLVSGGIVIGVAMVMFVRHIFVRSQGGMKNGFHKSGADKFETTWTDPAIDLKPNFKDSDDEDDIQSENDMYHSDAVTSSDDNQSEFEEEEDELVEDQLLPDSELKSGLELLFLKQQRHYWNQRRRHERANLQ